VLNGDYLAIDGEHLEEVADALQAKGSTCTRDDNLAWNDGDAPQRR